MNQPTTSEQQLQAIRQSVCLSSIIAAHIHKLPNTVNVSSDTTSICFTVTCLNTCVVRLAPWLHIWKVWDLNLILSHFQDVSTPKFSIHFVCSLHPKHMYGKSIRQVMCVNVTLWRVRVTTGPRGVNFVTFIHQSVFQIPVYQTSRSISTKLCLRGLHQNSCSNSSHRVFS